MTEPDRAGVRFGAGELERLKEIVAEVSPRRILPVLGQSFFRASPHFSRLAGFLAGPEILETQAVPANPTSEFLGRLSEKIRPMRPDLVIAAGGGSVLDTGKTLAALLTQPECPVEDYFTGRRRFDAAPVPCAAVPTTSGTGSEVTPYASFETPDRQKASLEAPQLVPAYAIVDPELCVSMPPYVTASTGMDALSQGIESYWSKRQDVVSDAHALEAVRLAAASLARAVRAPADLEARTRMARASLEAGLAIARTRTTAVHSVSYPITTYFKIAHGHACALTLAAFIRFNAPAIRPERGSRLWAALGASGPEDAAKGIEKLMDDIGLERSLRRLGIDAKGIEIILANGFRPDRVGNNPRVLSRAELSDILNAVY